MSEAQTAWGAHRFTDDGHGHCTVCGLQADDGRAEHVTQGDAPCPRCGLPPVSHPSECPWNPPGR